MLERLSTSFAVQKNFASNAAHELRTPLATIKAGIQVLELDEEPTSMDYKEAIEIAKESNERLIQIVDNLLLLTKENKDGFEAQVPIEGLLTEVQRELLPLSEKSGVTLAVRNAKGVLKGNKTLLYRAFYNLVENGMKYCQSGSVIVIESNEDDKKVRITVSDNGPGIPPESISHIFEAFYRVDKSRSRAIGGSGLGLSIVKGIVEKHRGTIGVESTLGKGTLFTLEFDK
jgi:signal transduction histidine kinase